MVFVLIILFYCVDDYLARITNNPELGQVPIWVSITLGIILSIIGWLFSDKRP
jgi:hypothetical protein